MFDYVRSWDPKAYSPESLSAYQLEKDFKRILKHDKEIKGYISLSNYLNLLSFTCAHIHSMRAVDRLGVILIDHKEMQNNLKDMTDHIMESLKDLLSRTFRHASVQAVGHLEDDLAVELFSLSLSLSLSLISY